MRKPKLSAAAAGANRAVDGLTSRIDGQTAEVSARAAQVIALAVRVLRWPTLVFLILPLPFTAVVVAAAVFSDGLLQWIAAVVALGLAAVSIALGVRRYMILKAVEDEESLASELAIAVSLSERVDETREALGELTDQSGPRIFSRLSGLWHTAGVGTHLITGIGDLPKAKYFFPPKVGSTVAISIAAAWLIPVAVVCAVILGIAAIAN